MLTANFALGEEISTLKRNARGSRPKRWAILDLRTQSIIASHGVTI